MNEENILQRAPSNPPPAHVTATLRILMKTNLTSIIRTLTLAGALTASLVVQAQPTITSVYPDGTRLFQYSTTLSFLASSPAGVTNVTEGSRFYRAQISQP